MRGPRRHLAALAALAALLAPAAHGADAGATDPLRRFALVAGASRGGPTRPTLRYALSDAREVARVFRALGGVAPDDLTLLEEPDAERVRAALAALGQATARARAAGRRVELFVYYSGHADEAGLLLGAGALSYPDLRRALDAVPADVRVAVLDSCASGAFTRAKGGEHRAPFLLDASQQVSGHAFLTSSTADEASQESDRLGASFFTHALLTGLRGAADASGDRVVTLNEAYQFAYQQTLARTEATQAGPQHATFDIGLVGRGDVVLTDLRQARAALVLPAATAGQVFVRSASGQLVAELRKQRGAPVELALDAGAYDVRLLRDRAALEGTVRVADGGRAVLEEAALAPVALEATARRGDGGPATAEEEEPPARRAGPARRHLLWLGLGGSGYTAQATPGAQSSSGGLALALGYAHPLAERWALTFDAGVKAVQSSSTLDGTGVHASASKVLPLFAGARWALPIGDGGDASLHLDAAVGLHYGVDDVSDVSSSVSARSVSSTALAGRLGAGVDLLATSHLLLGLSAAWTLQASFEQAIGGRTSYGGPEALAVAGWSW